MEKEKLGLEPAFANVAFDKTGTFTHLEDQGHYGMTKRFYAACAAMQGILSNPAFSGLKSNPSDISKMSYAMADEILNKEL